MSSTLRSIDFNDGKGARVLVPDWANVQNKPFTVSGGDTLTWDGNTEGLDVINLMGNGPYLYRVSDSVPDLDEITEECTGTLADYDGDTDPVINLRNISRLGDAGCLAFVDVCWIAFIAEDNPVVDGAELPYLKGTYFEKRTSDGGYISSFTVNGSSIFAVEKLKKSALPDTVATKDYVQELLGVIENGTY